MDKKIKMPLADRLQLLSNKKEYSNYNKDKLEENLCLQVIEWLDSLSETNVQIK